MPAEHIRITLEISTLSLDVWKLLPSSTPRGLRFRLSIADLVENDVKRQLAVLNYQ